METRLLVGGLAVASAFACLFSVSLLAGNGVRKRWAAIAVQESDPSVASFASWRLRNGFALLEPVASRLLRIGRLSKTVDELVLACDERGCPTTPVALLTALLAALMLLLAVSAIVTGSVVGAFAVPACAVAVIVVVAGNQADKRQEAVRDAVPGALEAMSACFGSGFTLLQTFQQVEQEVSGPLGATFGRSAHILETGGSAESALAELRDGAHASELAFVAVALDVQHQSGGAIRQVLDAAADTVKGELALRRSLRVQTAQAKLSARVVVIMPFILVAAFSLVSPDFLSPFFGSAAGYALLTLAMVMQVAGIVLVRRALAVDGVS